MSEQRRVYHVIDSVKGGCGKTTLSIMLNQYLVKCRDKSDELEKEVGETCLLDMDFYGTAMVNLFLSKGMLEKFSEEHAFLNDKIRGFKKDSKNYIYTMKIGWSSVHVGFADPSIDAKNEFRLMSRYNYTPVIKYGTYKNGIKNIIKKKDLEEQVNGKGESIRNVILDMAPGSDIYSDAVRDCLFERKSYQFFDEGDGRNYYLMVGMDESHLVAAENYMLQMLENNDILPDRIFIVFNDIMHIFKQDEEAQEQYNVRREQFDEVLARQSDDFKERIHYLVMHPFEEYARHIQGLKSLSEARGAVFPEFPFRYCAGCGCEFKLIAETKEQEEVLKWLL